MPSTLPAPIDKLAIVVVTYKRQELLANLFDSMTELTATPWRIVIVDNENSRETEAMCTAFNERLANRGASTPSSLTRRAAPTVSSTPRSSKTAAVRAASPPALNAPTTWAPSGSG